MYLRFVALLVYLLLFVVACSDKDKNAGGTSEAENSIAIENKDIAGVSQKGPFVKGSSVTLYELNFETRAQTGKSFLGRISEDMGTFAISKIELASQYALLRVDGFYRNEVTGKVSASQITLNAISDLSDRDNVNINLLTHLEYERALWLAQNEDMTVKQAKKIADQEIFEAFAEDFAGESVEDLDIFGNADGDAVLLAISIIMQAGRSEGEFSLSLADLAKDIEEDGVWNDSLERAQSADNAFEVELAQVRENILGWNISQKISMFENYVEYFWSDVFGLGRCTEKREGEIRPDTNPRSRYFNEKFICEKQHWHLLGKKLSSSSTEESSSSSISAESSSSSANDSSESGKSSSSIKRSSSSRQSTATIDPPYKEETSIIDPEVLAILGTCNDEGEGSVKKAFNSSFVCKSGLWYSLLLADMEQDSWFNPDITYGTLIDQRDGQTYRTVVIGTQNWMAENLHYGGENASEELATNMADENLCPSGDEEYCEKSGYVYSWTAAMNLSPTYRSRVVSSYPITSNHQGICPDGWHVPSKEEWNVLIEYVKNTYSEGLGAIRASDSWVWFSKDIAPTNATGFSMLATGMTFESWGRIDMGVSTAFISGDVPTISLGMPCLAIQEFFYNENNIKEFISTSDAFNVRCVENATPTSSENSSSSVKQSSSSQQSATTIDSPYDENTSIIDPELLAILGTCNSENESAVKKVYNNSFICKSGLWYSLLLIDMEKDSWYNPDITYGTLTDQRDGQTYRTVVIGTQNWMAENLHYAGEKADATTLANLAEENLCPWNDENYCSKSGYHYSWTAAMNISPIYKNRIAASYPITDKHQGLCPNGWHIPTYDEWNELFDFVISVYGEVAPSRALKAVDGWTWFSKEQAPTNSTGLSILGTGQYYSWGHSEGEEIGQSTYFITATTPESKYYTIELFGFTQNLHDIGNYDFSQPAFVRCVENAAP